MEMPVSAKVCHDGSAFFPFRSLAHRCSWGSLSSIIEHWGEYGSFLVNWAAPGYFHDMDMLLIVSVRALISDR